MSTLRTWRLAVLLAGGMSTAAFADHRGGHSKPYTLALDALVGPTTTDVVLRIAAPGGQALPDEIDHLLLWTATAGGQVSWVKLFRDIPLSGGQGVLSDLPIPAHTRVSAIAEVRIAGSHGVQILSASAVALDRPDLRIAQINAPSDVQIGQIVNIGVVIQEIRGYRGATFNVQLTDGATPLDLVTGATIDPMGTTTAVFAVRFDTVGTHVLTATIADASPAEFDTTNNSATFAIRVLDLLPTSYSLAYQRIEGEFSDNHLASKTSTLDDGTTSETRTTEQESRYAEIGRHETLNYVESSDRFVSGTLSLSVTIRVDGVDQVALAVTGWTPFSVSGGAGWAESTYQVYDPDSNAHVYLDSMSSAKGSSTLFQYSRTAGDYTFTSAQYDRFWSTVTTIDPVTGQPVTTVTSGETVVDSSGTVVIGSFLDAFTTIQMRSILSAGDVALGGWTQEVAVVVSSVDRTWDTSSSDASSTIHDWGYERRTYYDASGSGVTTP